MNPSPSNSRIDGVDSDSDDSVVIVDDVKVEPDVMEVEPDEEEDKPPTFEEEIISMAVGEEPSGTDVVARIMIRIPDRKRLIRKFLLADTVTKLYAFIAVRVYRISSLNLILYSLNSGVLNRILFFSKLLSFLLRHVRKQSTFHSNRSNAMTMPRVGKPSSARVDFFLRICGHV